MVGRQELLVLGRRLEVVQWGSDPGADDGVTVVLLHHGLGSVATWGDLPERIAERTGRPVVAYSRWGYGKSEPVTDEDLPRPVSFMHDEAREELPALLAALGIRRPVLVGHSDGGSIALLYASDGFKAGGFAPPAVGLVLLAPHVFVEEVTLAGARAAVREYESGTLRKLLARVHANPDSAFGLWSRTWLQPDFAHWNIEREISGVDEACPVTVLQGSADEYGTGAQLRALEARLQSRRLNIELLSDCGHLVQRDRPDAVLEAVVGVLPRR